MASTTQYRTYTELQTLERITCANCGVLFAMPEHMVNSRRKDKTDFWCPNGHCLSFRKSSLDIEREKSRALEAQLVSARDQARASREDAERTRRSNNALKGQVTRHKRRASAGVCPVDGCGRTFQQLARHMKTKHPDLDPETLLNHQHGAQREREAELTADRRAGVVGTPPK